MVRYKTIVMTRKSIYGVAKKWWTQKGNLSCFILCKLCDYARRGCLSLRYTGASTYETTVGVDRCSSCRRRLRTSRGDDDDDGGVNPRSAVFSLYHQHALSLLHCRVCKHDRLQRRVNRGEGTGFGVSFVELFRVLKLLDRLKFEKFQLWF